MHQKYKKLSLKELKRRFIYRPESGEFIRIMGHGVKNKSLHYVNGKGYAEIFLLNERYLASRLAWFYMTGKWPRNLVDHKNGNSIDNSWDNLREANSYMNGQNQHKAQAHSKTGILGVIKKGNRYQSHIKIIGKQTYLGSFKTKEIARQAYLAAKKRHHKGYIESKIKET